jgi:hypothetical protein
MGDGTEFDDALLGLPGFRVTALTDYGRGLLAAVETLLFDRGYDNNNALTSPGVAPTSTASLTLAINS